MTLSLIRKYGLKKCIQAYGIITLIYVLLYVGWLYGLYYFFIIGSKNEGLIFWLIISTIAVVINSFILIFHKSKTNLGKAARYVEKKDSDMNYWGRHW